MSETDTEELLGGLSDLEPPEEEAGIQRERIDTAISSALAAPPVSGRAPRWLWTSLALATVLAIVAVVWLLFGKSPAEPIGLVTKGTITIGNDTLTQGGLVTPRKVLTAGPDGAQVVLGDGVQLDARKGTRFVIFNKTVWHGANASILSGTLEAMVRTRPTEPFVLVSDEMRARTFDGLMMATRTTSPKATAIQMKAGVAWVEPHNDAMPRMLNAGQRLQLPQAATLRRPARTPEKKPAKRLRRPTIRSVQ